MIENRGHCVRNPLGGNTGKAPVGQGPQARVALLDDLLSLLGRPCWTNMTGGQPELCPFVPHAI